MPRFITDSRVAPTDKAPLRAIGLGLPRAATSSLQAAFEEVGYGPCLHMAQIIPHPDRLQLIIDASYEKNTETRHKMLHTLIDGYSAVCDVPAILFYKDFMEMFPDAKLVLNGRPNPEVWAQSCRESFGYFFSPWFYYVGFLWSVDRLWHRLNMRVVEYYKELYDEPSIFQASAYTKYYQSVRDDAKANRWTLLEFQAEEGWAPLCKFLEQDVPDKSFPRVNERKTFQVVKRVFIAKGILSWMAVGGIIWAGWSQGPWLLSRLRGLMPAF
ncbi:unnamed protein product [Clonostachys solani]|uniref:Uncharacterized protein n=1 Tax=Clonostachys solani TaxID=160281 RepID=A0A9P0EHC7_9HYPO|nr:unnamed protein product [Clonostachys solani]